MRRHGAHGHLAAAAVPLRLGGGQGAAEVVQAQVKNALKTVFLDLEEKRRTIINRNMKLLLTTSTARRYSMTRNSMEPSSE